MLMEMALPTTSSECCRVGVWGCYSSDVALWSMMMTVESPAAGMLWFMAYITST